MMGATGPVDGGVVGDGDAVGLGVGLGAGLGVDVGVAVGVFDGSGDGVEVSVGVGLGEAVSVGDGVGVGVGVDVGVVELESGDGVGSTAIAGRAPPTTSAAETAIAVIHRARPSPNLRMRNPRHSLHSAFCRETRGYRHLVTLPGRRIRR